MQRVILTSIAYMPPIEFFVNLKGASAVWIEQHENYQKQTFRNRTQIYASNGVQNLIIPVQRAIHTKIKDTLIDYRTPWQRNHWRSITAAYNNSPYFLYYKDAIEPFYRTVGIPLSVQLPIAASFSQNIEYRDTALFDRKL